jgi:hypothetical protein
MPWRTATGKAIAFRAMTNTHLLNVIAYLERKAKAHLEAVYLMPWPTAEYASMEFEKEVNAMEKMTLQELADHIHPQYHSLVREALRRKILPGKGYQEIL